MKQSFLNKQFANACKLFLVFIFILASIKLDAQNKDTTKTYGSYSGECSKPYKTEMKVNVGECITTVNTSISGSPTIKAFTVYQRDGLVATKDGKILTVAIPNDGENYWFVPFDSNGTAKMCVAGVTLNCSCSACGGCDLVYHGNNETCDNTNFCKGCCELTATSGGKISTTGGGVAKIFSGGGVIVSGDTLVINGVFYK